MKTKDIQLARSVMEEVIDYTILPAVASNCGKYFIILSKALDKTIFTYEQFSYINKRKQNTKELFKSLDNLAYELDRQVKAKVHRRGDST